MKMFIRHYKNSIDRNFIRDLCCRTAFLGDPVEKFFIGREILADLLTLYYTDYEPESIFIAETDNRKIGYILGCKNIRKQRKIFLKRILPLIVIKSFLKGVIFKKRNLIFLLNCTNSFIKKELFNPDFSKEYPATMHINIDCIYRGLGIGENLVKEYFDYLKKERIKGIFLTTISDKAVKFFEKMGFVILHKKKISYFDYLGFKGLYKFVLGKKLNF